MDLVPLLVLALLLQSSILALQVGDAIAGFIDARRVRDTDDPEVLTRNTVRELIWTMAVAAVAAVMLAFGVDIAARLVLDDNRPVAAFLILLAVAVLAFGIGSLTVLAVVRRDRPTYARIRRDLRDRAVLQLTLEELEHFETRLADADRAVARRSGVAPTLRLVALLVVLGLGVAASFAAITDGIVWFAVGTIAAVALSVAAFIVAVRAAAVRQEAIDAVRAAQRAEVVALLERARIPQRKNVPGLRDRVSRALAILREQQK